MHERLLSLLACPSCRGSLRWTVGSHRGEELWEGSARCDACGGSYPLRDGIAALLPSAGSAEDLWAEAGSWIRSLPSEHPEETRQLLDSPIDELGGTDLLVRGMLLEARHEFGEAKPVLGRAIEALYAPEMRSASQRQFHELLARLAAAPSPVVDLASGRGMLLEFLLPRCRHAFVATDVSPAVLARSRRYLETLAPGDRLDLVALDARHLPFPDNSVPTMVTNVGLMNIQEPGSLVPELRRVLAGSLLAVTAFYPEEGGPNGEAIARMGLESMVYRERALRSFEEAGFSVEVANTVRARAVPTPEGKILEGLRPDRLPVVETVLEWCTLVVR